jgi:anti-sigma B factor antagonist
MEISERKIGRVDVIKIEGQAILNAQPEKLSQVVRDRLQAGDRLFVLNLSDCTRMDSTGLGELVKSHKLIADCEGILTLAKVPPVLRSLISVTNLDEMIGIFDSEQAAINSFGA